jgi:tetratricopeptide (TPR) repeat protein
MEVLAGLEKEGLHGNGETDMAIGSCLNQLGEPAQAVDYFVRGHAMLLESPAAQEVGADYVNNRPYGLSDLNSWGMALDTLERLDEALVVYARALAVAPTLHQLNNNVGNIKRKLKRPAEAIRYYDTAVAEDPTQKLYVYNRGMCLRDLHETRHGEAVAAMTEALRLDPEFFQASHELAGLIRREAGVTEPRLQEALRHQRAAVKLAPDRGEYHFALGEIHAVRNIQQQRHRHTPNVATSLIRNRRASYPLILNASGSRCIVAGLG